MKTILATLLLTLSLTAMADTNYSCFGTEPFWGIEVKGDSVTFNPYDLVPATEKITSRENALGVTEGYALMITTATTTTAITTAECNDGMSDNVYTHTVLYKTPDALFYGCCNIAK